MSRFSDTLSQLYQQHGGDYQGEPVCCHYPKIALYGRDQPQQSTPVMYPQGMAVLAQGRKQVRFGQQRFDYDNQDILLIATSYPIECHSFASKSQPMLGMYLPFELPLLRPMVAQLQQQHGDSYFAPYQGSGVDKLRRNEALHQALNQLAQALLQPASANALAPHWLAIIYYQLLTGPKRHLLAALVQQDQHLARISASIEHIQQNLEQKLTVEQLAQVAGMSESAFFRAFKASVADSPLQYLKKLRLNKAKGLIVYQGMAASAAAFAVGYESATQFSREFKRYFGTPPSKIPAL
ncbi:AraC family transcriptional regulator [Ferrimonas senticii]|uniref:AraC family transcriptional regulator n=1 Tax=Ferrimonas senticii TaxID=394566 RepID=UPI0003F9574A|nr:AraC family transcriptional regulator N-terminal domain-containing protein [Ferrimonas senticii]